MAQKAAKSLATRNAAKLQQSHLITLVLHFIFLLLSFTLRRSLSVKSWLLFSLPAFVLEGYLEVLGRPKYSPDGVTLKKAGEDLDAKGLTEFFWDVIYWTWINVIVVILFGNKGWWAYILVPAYTGYAIFGTVNGIRGMLGGGNLAGAAGQGENASGTTGQSKRQAKLDKRGGDQRTRYR